MQDTGKPTAFVTGAAGGIGRATAINLSTTHAVIAVDRDQAGLQQTVELIEAQKGACVAFPADVTDFEPLTRAVSLGQERFGTISVAVACAGIEVQGSVADLDFEEWNKSINVNLTGTFATAKAVIASLLETKGTFTVIASDAGTQGAQGYSAYVAAKHGIVGLVRCMALDYGPVGVRSNVICPGFVETPMWTRLFAESSAEEVDFYRRSVPLGRFAKPEEIAAAVRHFAESSYTNGSVYAIDGGATAGYFVGSG